MDEFLTPNANLARLLQDYEKHGSLVVAYDFDGTVHDYHKKGASYEMVRQLIRDLKSIGCKLVCWTAYEKLDYVWNFLEENNIPCDHVNEGGIPLPWESKKPFFSALLDDRAGLESMYRDLDALVKIVKKKKDAELQEKVIRGDSR